MQFPFDECSNIQKKIHCNKIDKFKAITQCLIEPYRCPIYL